MITIGTYSLRAEQCVQAVKLALEIGYRRIDTASGYKNEHLVSQGILLSKVPRTEIHITTKVGPKDIAKGYEGVRKCVQQSLVDLYSANDNDNKNNNNINNNSDYIDCVLLHWPGAAGFAPESDRHKELRIEAWKALCDLKQTGVVREIGVSNFLVRHLESITSTSTTTATLNSSLPATTGIDVVQMELHPWCEQKEVVDWCVAHGVRRIESYGLFGAGKCLERVKQMLKMKDQPERKRNMDENGNNEDVENDEHQQDKVSAEVSELENNKKACQLLLHWCVRQKGFVPVVRASKKEHLEQNLIFVQERPVRDEGRNFFQRQNNDDDDEDDDKNVDEHFYWHANLIA